MRPTVFKSFPVMGAEDDGDDIRVVGRCSDGEVDLDGDVVSPQFMKSAVDAWMRICPVLRLEHRDYAAGRGLEAWQDADGSTWVKSLIADDKAKRLWKSGQLTSYSVGIHDPQTRPHPKAPRWEIYGGRLTEVSLVRSPSNTRCGVMVCKSVNGVPRYIGKAWNVADKGRKAEKHMRKAAKLLGVPVPQLEVNAAHQALYDDPAAYRAWLAKQVGGSEPALDSVAAMFLNSSDPQLREMVYDALGGEHGQGR